MPFTDTNSAVDQMTAGWQSVPAALPQSQSPSQLDEIIRNISTPIDPGIIRAANTPIPGAHGSQVPSSLQTPVAPHQNSPMIDTRGIVGRKQGKMAGIGNAIIGATNAIGAVVSAEAQVKQDSIKDAATKVIMSQQGIDEAKQALDAAHASGDTQAAAKAQELIDHNTKARDGIFADPKLRKALAKGFDISYTDPASNKTEEHAAVQAAMKQAKTLQEKKEIQKRMQQEANAKAGAAAGAAYEKAAPQGTAPNTIAQGQYAAALEQRKNAVETLKAMGPVYAAQLRANRALNVAQLNKDAEIYKAGIEAQSKLDDQILKNRQDDKNNTAARGLEELRGSIQKSVEMLKQGNPVEVMNLFNTASKNYESSIGEIQKSRQALNNELDKKPGGSRETEIRRQLQGLDEASDSAKNAFTLNRNVIAKGLGLQVTDERLQVPTIHVGDGVSNGTSSGSGNSSTNSTDLDPRSGKPWDARVSATDRAIVKAHYGITVLSNRVEDTIQNVNKDVRKFTRFFDGESNNRD